MLHSGTCVHSNIKARTSPLNHVYSPMIVRSSNLSRLHSVFKISSAACLALLHVNASVPVRRGAYSN